MEIGKNENYWRFLTKHLPQLKAGYQYRFRTSWLLGEPEKITVVDKHKTIRKQVKKIKFYAAHLVSLNTFLAVVKESFNNYLVSEKQPRQKPKGATRG